ncbi:hypothetical protein [Halococcus sp. AFM35]|uniref:hypothetical protein n=1 Tax=Halococcus sp. AFM35 TaxID=3421653 RepID=UPI003EBFD83F
MNLDTTQKDDIVEAVTGIGGVFIIGGTLLSVYTGTLGVPDALEIILPILGALGIYESGRRRGKKSPLVKMALEQVDALGEQQGMQDASESTSASQASQTDPPSADEQNFANSVTPSDSQTGSTYAQVREAIERADYGTLRQVATLVDGAQGAGEGNTIDKMREDLRAADPAEVASAFETVTSNRTDGSG